MDILLSFFLFKYSYVKMKNYLNFETDIKNLENELEKLKDPFNQEGLSEVDTKKISKTQEEIDEKQDKLIEAQKTMTPP